jgi:hypothetical protein
LSAEFVAIRFLPRLVLQLLHPFVKSDFLSTQSLALKGSSGCRRLGLAATGGTNGKLRLADATPDRGLLEKRMFIKDQIVKKSGSRRNPRARLRSPSGRSPESQIHKLRQPPSPSRRRRRRRRRRPPPRPSISLPPSPYGFHLEGPPDARTSRPPRPASSLLLVPVVRQGAPSRRRYSTFSPVPTVKASPGQSPP